MGRVVVCCSWSVWIGLLQVTSQPGSAGHPRPACLYIRSNCLRASNSLH
jgi:hypothetical protein